MMATVRSALPYCAVAAALAWVTTRAVLERNSGLPGVPLDDAYIHFQYARAFSHGHPFEYTASSAPAPGATSLLWPLVLSPFARVLHGESLVWVAWALGWTALAALAWETSRLAEPLTTPLSSIAAGALVLAFGAFAWFAASGMEVVPFAWLLARTARKSAEWVEAGSSELEARSLASLVALAWVCPLMRPEGVLGTLTVTLALCLAPHRRRHGYAVLAAVGMAAPSVVNLLGTGQAMSTTAAAKWLPFNPYYEDGALVRAVVANVRLLLTTLWNGELWTSLFVPAHGAVVAWCALPAIAWAGFRSRGRARAAFVLILSLGVFIPATYETFLVNRVRYVWPFTPGWFIGLVILCDLVGDAARRVRTEFSALRLLAAAALIALFASRLDPAIDDVASSTEAVTLQQVSLGKWAAEALPESCLVGVNDTGAIAYFGGRRTFDIVGLTTRGEARFWTAGPGSRFEHYERLPRSQLPTHFIVYPEWFALDELLGRRMTARTVSHTILGGTTMTAYEASWASLGSGAAPRAFEVAGRKAVDALDVADLESEEAHEYGLFEATQAENVVFSDGSSVDGGRLGRRLDRFRLDVRPNGVVVARLWLSAKTRLRVGIGDRALPELTLQEGGPQEVAFRVPDGAPALHQTVEVHALEGPRFASLHYWSYEPAAP